MKKLDLIQKGDTILRVLQIKDDEALVVDCRGLTMPRWIKKSETDGFEICEKGVLREYPSVNDLDREHRKIAYDRFEMISSILPFLSNKKERSAAVKRCATEHLLSEQTIKKYLLLYLVHQNIAVLAPTYKAKKEELSSDEKNIRYALNKYFYSPKKHSLTMAYTMMLKDKYCDEAGNLSKAHPSFYQFRYFYRKHRKLQNFYISRYGLKYYQRNKRPLLGDGMQELAPSIGVGMLDATVCDIYLVNESGGLVGRPILTACVDAYSGLCCGYSLTWEGGVYSLRDLMCNVVTDKTFLCKSFGIHIKKEAWNCDMLPRVLVTDMGKEYTGGVFEQISELGVRLTNLPPYRPELKGRVEKFFDLIQNLYKPHLKGKGVVEADYQERGAHDYRKDARLTMRAFEKIVIRCILYYNTARVMEKFPLTDEMLAEGVKACASNIWNHELKSHSAELIKVSGKELTLTLLPRVVGKFGRGGLTVNKLRYHADGYTEKYLAGGTTTVAYNPDDVTEVWVIEDGKFVPFTLIEKRFEGQTLSSVESSLAERKLGLAASEKESLQAKIDLAEHICAIASCSEPQRDIVIKNIRHNRKKEKLITHVDHMKGAIRHE